MPLLAVYDGVASFAVLQHVPAGTPTVVLSMQGHGDVVGGFETYLYTPSNATFELLDNTARSDNQIDTVFLDGHIF